MCKKLPQTEANPPCPFQADCGSAPVYTLIFVSPYFTPDVCLCPIPTLTQPLQTRPHLDLPYPDRLLTLRFS